MNLIISAVTIIDLTNKKAKKITFSPGKNLLTSAHNHLGKSVVMKSLYYTLGADVFFPYPIKRLNLLTYIDFSLCNHQYRVARLKNSFALYCGDSLYGVYPSVGAFEEELSSIFNLEINLIGKDQDGTILKCPPAFYYIPYYIDQENGWSPTSFSFDKMTQFDLPQRKNSYFFHMGVLDSEYVEISKRQKSNDRQVCVLTKENEKYKTVIETLKSGLNETQMSFDMASLEHAISHRQSEIKRILDDISKVREELVEAEDRFVQLTHDKEILSKYIKKKQPISDQVETELLECPRCGMVFERSIRQRLEKTYLLESLHDDYSNLLEQEVRLKNRIKKLSTKFSDYQGILVEYEKSLTSDRETYNTYVKSKATNQLLNEYYESIARNDAKIDKLHKDSVEIRKLLDKYTQEKSKANDCYLSALGKMLMNLDIPADQIEDNSEPGSALVASGAYGPRCKIAQILAFIETQKDIAPEKIRFPLVIDSPNALEQDNEHLESVIHTLFTWDKTDNQIIVASIHGKDAATEIPGVNIITLENPKDNLFNSEEYSIHEGEFSQIFLQF